MLSSLLVLAAASCRTGAPREDITQLSKDGAWEAKALIQDKKNSKTHQLDLDFIAQRPRRLRMEATTPGLGIHVASFVLNGQEMSYLLTRQKRFVTGPATEESARELLRVSLAPQTLVDLLFDRTPDEKNWKCQLGSNAQLEKCQHRDADLSITWSERTAERRIVEINSANARVTMSLKETPSKVQVTDQLFQLSPPEGFKTQRLD